MRSERLSPASGRAVLVVVCLEYLKANDTLAQAVRVWARNPQSTPGVVYVPVTR